MSGRMNARGPRRASPGAAVDPFADRAAEDHKTFDALADLFLGELSPKVPAADLAAPLNAAPGRDARSGAPQHAIAEPARPSTRPGTASPGGTSGGGGGGTVKATIRPAVELLILGHLPALASVWGTQYLRDRARELGAPIVSLRVQAGFTSVELFGDPPNQHPPAGAASTFEDALALAGRGARRWFIRADGPAELEYVDARVVTTVTLLTGADEAATIGAYRTIKQLAARIDAIAPTPAPKLRVVVMGADTEQAERVGRKLAETANSCLGRSVGYEVSSARIGASRPATILFNGRTDLGPAATLSAISNAVESASPIQSSPSSPYSVATPRPHTPHARESDGMLEEAAAALAASLPAALASDSSTIAQPFSPPSRKAAPPQRPAVPNAPDPTRRAEPVKAAPATVQPEPVHSIAPASRRPVSPLAAHARGLFPIDVQCPYAPAVEFAIDASGRMHVLARFDAGPIDESSLGVLLIASEWAQAHASLLRAAAPVLAQHACATIDTSCRPEMHVFTDAPRKVRRLLETDVRVHLLSPVDVEGRSGWFCTALN